MYNESLKTFKPLSDFKNRSVTLYRSSDIETTKIYFTNKEEPTNPYFEVLKFKYEYGKNYLYVRYPNTDYFVEFYGWLSCAHGDMEEWRNLKNIWKEDYFNHIDFYFHDKDLMINIGSKNSKMEFNFLRKIASMNNENIQDLNNEEIEKVLSLNYLMLPLEVKYIDYCYKTKDNNPNYYIVYHPKYDFSYNNFQLFEIKNNIPKEYKVIDVERYRDGGTTYVKTEDNHVLFSPTPFNENGIPNFDKIELEKCSEDDRKFLIRLLNIIAEEKDI